MLCIHKRLAEANLYKSLTENRIVILRGEIDDPTAEFAIASMLFLKFQSKEEPIYLYIDSPGGSVTAGFAILDTIDHLGADTPVYTHCIAEAHGMAGLILAHGSQGNRFACLDARCTLVPLTANKKPPNVEEHLAKTREGVTRRLALDTGQSEATIIQDMESWLTLDARQAVDYGLIDSVVD